jgi:hypothetical protein
METVFNSAETAFDVTALRHQYLTHTPQAFLDPAPAPPPSEPIAPRGPLPAERLHGYPYQRSLDSVRGYHAGAADAWLTEV